MFFKTVLHSTWNYSQLPNLKQEKLLLFRASELFEYFSPPKRVKCFAYAQFYVLLLLKGMIKGCFFLFYVIFKVIFYVFFGNFVC